MFKLTPIAEAVFEGFLQRIVSIDTFQWAPYLAGTTFASNNTLLSGDGGTSGEALVRTRRFVGSFSNVERTTPSEVQDELKSSFPVTIRIGYTARVGFSAQNIHLYPDDRHAERFLQAEPSSEFTPWSTFRVTATYRFNTNYYLTDIFDPRRNLETLYTYTMRMDKIPKITTVTPDEDIDEGITSVYAELYFVEGRGNLSNKLVLFDETYPIKEGVLTPALSAAIYSIVHVPTQRVLRLQGDSGHNLSLQYVYYNRDQPQFALSVNGSLDLYFPPELFAQGVDLSEYEFKVEMPTTSYNSVVWEKPTVPIPSDYVTGAQDRAWFTWVYSSSPPPYRSGYELKPDIISFPIDSTMGDFIESTWVAKYNRQLEIHNSLTKSAHLFSTTDDYNKLGILNGKSINGNAQLHGAFFYPDDNDATFRSRPLNSHRIRYRVRPMNDGGLNTTLFAVTNRDGKHYLERVPVGRSIRQGLNGVESIYSGQYGTYNFKFSLDSIPLFLDNAPQGQTITKVRAVYDLEHESRTESTGSSSTSIELRASFSILATVTDSLGNDLAEITLIKYRELITRLYVPNKDPMPVTSHGYNSLIRDGIDENTGHVILADLNYLPLSRTNPNVTYADVGAFLLENVQNVAPPPPPQH